MPHRKWGENKLQPSKVRSCVAKGDRERFTRARAPGPAHGGRVGRRRTLSAGAVSLRGRRQGRAERVPHPVLGRQEGLPGGGAGQGGDIPLPRAPPAEVPVRAGGRERPAARGVQERADLGPAAVQRQDSQIGPRRSMMLDADRQTDTSISISYRWRRRHIQ